MNKDELLNKLTELGSAFNVSIQNEMQLFSEKIIRKELQELFIKICLLNREFHHHTGITMTTDMAKSAFEFSKREMIRLFAEVLEGIKIKFTEIEPKDFNLVNEETLKEMSSRQKYTLQ